MVLLLIYLILIFDEEDLKTQKLSSEARSLQTLKNNMIRVINGLRVVQCVNTKYAKTERKNQNDDSKPNGCVPHNSRNLQYNASSEQIKDKDVHIKIDTQINVPKKPMPSCMGFTYILELNYSTD